MTEIVEEFGSLSGVDIADTVSSSPWVSADGDGSAIGGSGMLK